jgi:sulfate adenylyltransferase subunit 1
MALYRENIDLLRFAVIGSVDDGKSTLIGRLLYDTKSIFEDQLSAIEESSRSRGEEYVNLALLTDGLKAEREQGITIDVAYRYFSTPKRKFIIADCPGHIQYTRNMVTGTSNASVGVILVDVRNGVIEQTKRHAFITSLMGVKHLVVCVNKMDMVDYQEEAYQEIVADMKAFTSKLKIPEIHFIPISALKGDNIVDQTQKMPWYRGSSLLYLLETIHLASDDNHVDCRFPIQRVIRPMSEKFHDFRGYAGQISSGVFKPGDEVALLPSGFETRIKEIYSGEKKVDEAFYPMSVVMTLEENFDLSRGDMLVRSNNRPTVTQDLDVLICWLNERPLNPSAKYVVQQTTNSVRAKIKEVLYRIDIHTLHKDQETKDIKMNDIARIRLRVNRPLFTDSYQVNRKTGSLIIVDEQTHDTVGAAMII